MNKTMFSLFPAALAFATVFTLSCSGDDGNDDNSSSSVTTQGGGSSSSSSSDGGSSSSDANTSGVFIDPRDGQEYGFQPDANGLIWMSGNLNYSRDNTLGYCYGVDINEENAHRDSTTCDNGYGRAYESSVAMDDNSPQGLCPDGWHIPSNEEWNSLKSLSARNENSSNVFCTSMKTGNYNTNPSYPPIDWKERDELGFYWTSSGFNYFALFLDERECRPYYIEYLDMWSTTISVAISTRTQGEDYFFIRCVADSD